MLWRKAWRDTRMQFLILLAVLVSIAVFSVLGWPQVRTLLASLASRPSGDGRVGAAIAAAIAAQQTFRGYVSYQWFAQNFRNCIVLFAAVLGSGSALSSSGRGLLFSLSLPVARGRWIEARAAVGLAEMLALALVPSVAVTVAARSIDESYPLTDALVHGGLLFVLAAVFYALAMLVSSFVDDFGRALVLTVPVAVAAAVAEYALPAGHGLFAALSGGAYVRDGTLPWTELIVGVALTVAFVYGAAAHLARRDF